jgi:CRISPR-associated protein Csx14
VSFRISVDPANPGQFFACCGLLELADRLWPGVAGSFIEKNSYFEVTGADSLASLIRAIAKSDVRLLDQDDIYSGRVAIDLGPRPLVLDWWSGTSGLNDAKDLKIWAGTMESCGIARAMQRAMSGEQFFSPNLFDVGMVVSDADVPKKKKEPYYFDARRAPNAHSRDVGFSTNDLNLTTIAFPAVEFLCLIGLQRCVPRRRGNTRIYDYFTWSEPLIPAVLPAAVSGLLPFIGARGYRFENWFRTGQRKHKAFRPALPLPPGA